MDWELSFLMWIQEHIVNGFLTPIMKAFTTLGNGGILWIIIIVLLILFPKHETGDYLRGDFDC